MGFELRLLTSDDLSAAWELGRRAFGGGQTPPMGLVTAWESQRTWGAFDQGGRLVAQAMDREQQQWFGGRLVPACGVSGVVVAPELRGYGVARTVLTTLLAAARERGAVISTLFNTTAAPYRRLGWEEVAALTWTSLPTLVLARLRRPAHITLRPAVTADVPAVLALYQAVAKGGNGWMKRTGPLFATTPEGVLASHDGLTIASGPDGAIEGYAAWDRVCDGDGRLSVSELIALTEPATTALLAMLGHWASVTPTVMLRLPDRDPALLIVDAAGAELASRQPLMLRVIDAHAAVAARGWPQHVTGSVDLVLDDDVCPWNTGRFRLDVAAGSARLEPGGRAEVRLTMRGLALLYASAASPAVLRRAGLLSGGSDGADAFLQVATAGPAPAILDSF